MEKKNRQIRVRLTESQFKRLADALVQEQQKKSEVIREALDTYLIEKEYNKKVSVIKKK